MPDRSRTALGDFRNVLGGFRTALGDFRNVLDRSRTALGGFRTALGRSHKTHERPRSEL